MADAIPPYYYLEAARAISEYYDFESGYVNNAYARGGVNASVAYAVDCDVSPIEAAYLSVQGNWGHLTPLPTGGFSAVVR